MSSDKSSPVSLQSVFYTIVILAFVFYIFVVGQEILIPFVIAVFIWCLINAISDIFRKVLKVPDTILKVLSVIVLMAVVWFPVQLIVDSIPQVIEDAPKYQKNFENIVQKLLMNFEFGNTRILSQIYENIDIGVFITEAVKAVARFTGNFFLITLYVVFLLLEQTYFKQKLLYMFIESSSQKKAKKIMDDVYEKVKSYIWLKTVLSLVTSLLSFIVFKYVGLNYAAVWALLVFLLNFIPNIGSVVATIFPSLITLVQFDQMTSFFIVVSAVGMIQLIVGNVFEPKLMGRTLNLSSLVIIMSLILWGGVWGVSGAFLSVPIMVVLTIFFAEFSITRPLAILLSKDGKV